MRVGIFASASSGSNFQPGLKDCLPDSIDSLSPTQSKGLGPKLTERFRQGFTVLDSPAFEFAASKNQTPLSEVLVVHCILQLERFDPTIVDMNSNKEVIPGGQAILHLMVVRLNSTLVRYKINQKTRLHKLMCNYCSLFRLDMGQVGFRHRGEEIHDFETPFDLRMSDFDLIEAICDSGANGVPRIPPMPYGITYSNVAHGDNHRGERLKLIIMRENQINVTFKLRKETTLKTLMEAYCIHRDLDLARVRFLYDGQPVRPEDSPMSLNMACGDILEVFH